MPRDINGNFTLAPGNPVVPGTVIEAGWANPTMSDVASSLTDSLSRTGLGGMLVPFRNTDGAVGTPGMTWANETTSGWYRAGLNDFWYSVGNENIFRITKTGVALAAGKTFTGLALLSLTALTIATGSIVASTPGINLTQTWNNAAVTFVGADTNITDTASNAASILERWRVGGADRITAFKNGDLTITGNFTSIGMDDNATQEAFQLTNNSMNVGTAALDFVIQRTVSTNTLFISGGISNADGANIILRGSTHPTGAGDLFLRSNVTNILFWDESAGTLALTAVNGVNITGTLTATGSITGASFIGPLTGNADSATLAATVTVVDSTDPTSFIAMFDSATGNLAAKTDPSIQFDPTTGQLKLSSVGSTAGILIGGDVQWYRNAANVWRTPDSLIVDGTATIGGLVSAAVAFSVSGALTTGPTQSAVVCNSTFDPSGVTQVQGFRTSPTLADGSGVVYSLLSNFRVNDVVKAGAGDTLTTQVGYDTANLTVGANNYAFRGQVSAAAGRWNLFMNGTADNYLRGNVGINTQVFGTAADGVLAIGNGVVPTTSPANMIQVYSKDSSVGAANATLAIRTEQAVEAVGTFTAVSKLRVWINEIEYWIQLDPV